LQRDALDTTQGNLISNYRNAADDEARAAIKISLDANTVELIGTDNELSSYDLKLERLAMQKGNADARVAQLAGVDTTDQRSVWCVEYNVDLDGQVGTIEIDAEQPQILIAPGGAVYDPPADGVFTSRDVLSPEASFLNVALLPGVQKYSPTYRLGEITAVDAIADVASVLLDDATSSAQDLDINQITDLINVPVEYLNCNAKAFELGDRVVVKFEGQSVSSPKVIGFESNPKPCETSAQIRFARIDTPNIDIVYAMRFFNMDDANNNGGVETPGDRIWNKMSSILSGGAGYYPDPDELLVQYRESDAIGWTQLALTGYGITGVSNTQAYVFEVLGQGTNAAPYLRFANFKEIWYRGPGGLDETEGTQLESDNLYWWRGASPPNDCRHYMQSIKFHLTGLVQEYRILIDGVEEFRIAHNKNDHRMFGVDISDQNLEYEYGSIKQTFIQMTSLAPYSWKP